MANRTDDWTSVRLVAVDVEGNGRAPPEIVEIAVVAIEDGDVVEPVRQWLVHPKERITPVVSRLHGITNKMVADAPRFAEVAPAVREALHSDYLVAHNASVELGALSPLLPGWRPRGVIDTLALARKLAPGKKSYALTSLTKDLDVAVPVSGTGPHRAAYDALATARLFLRLARTDAGVARPLSALIRPEAPPDSGPQQGSLL